MRKKQAIVQSLSLFEPNETPQAQSLAASATQQTASSSFETAAAARTATQVDLTACPRCGGKSLLSKRPQEYGGRSRYCCVCPGEPGEPFRFEPQKVIFDAVVKTEITTERMPETTLAPSIEELRREAKEALEKRPSEPEISVSAPEVLPARNGAKLDLPVKPYFEENGIAILHGDCREILPQLGIYDLVLTDPPYGIGLEYVSYKDTPENLKKLIKEVFPMIRRSAAVVLLTPGNKNQYAYPKPDWTFAWFSPGGVGKGPWGFCEWQPVLAYGKDPYLREGLGSRGDTITDNSSDNIEGHPCTKPEKLWKWLLKRGASRSTDRILDPFLGSGTTLLAAKRLGHSAVGIDIEEKYCEIAAKRLNQKTLEF